MRREKEQAKLQEYLKLTDDVLSRVISDSGDNIAYLNGTAK